MTDEEDSRRISNGLDRMFRPRSIALVGATERSIWSVAAYDNLVRFGFTGRIIPVNPKGGIIHGLQAVTSIAAAGEPIDVALLMMPEASLLDTIGDLQAARVAGASLTESDFMLSVSSVMVSCMISKFRRATACAPSIATRLASAKASRLRLCVARTASISGIPGIFMSLKNLEKSKSAREPGILGNLGGANSKRVAAGFSVLLSTMDRSLQVRAIFWPKLCYHVCDAFCYLSV